MAQKTLQLVGNLRTEVEAITTSAGSGDAGKIPALDSTGRFDSSMMPVGIGADTGTYESSENLTAGDFVNVYNDAGTTKVRKADASTASAARRANGFVLANVTSPANATVYFEGQNTQLSGLTAGTTYALSHTTPGGVVALASATATAGHILQVLGDAVGTTVISTEIAQPIVRG
jgi:hypothetical protein